MTGGYLIVRRDGALWGLPADAVTTIERSGEARSGDMLELQLAGGGRLAVDAVLRLAGELVVKPLSARLRPFLPPGAAGLALLGGEPLVLMNREIGNAHD